MVTTRSQAGSRRESPQGKFHQSRRRISAMVRSEHVPTAYLPAPPPEDIAAGPQDPPDSQDGRVTPPRSSSWPQQRSRNSGTPHRQSASSARNASSVGNNPTSVSKANRKYMDAEVEARLRTGVAAVAKEAQPRGKAGRTSWRRIVGMATRSVRNWRQGKQVPQSQSDQQWPAYQEFEAARPWITGEYFKNEPQMYPCISAFIRMVAHFVKADLDEHGGVCGLVLPFRATNSVPSLSADQNKIDIGLGVESPTAGVGSLEDLDYSGIFAIFEAKRCGSSHTFEGLKKKASAQLFDYSRQLYANQIDRRFLWGLTCVDTKVFACLFGNYRAYESPEMDVSGDEGCDEFIRLLVGWSLCSWRQLGYDSTMQWDEERRCYAIQVPSGARSKEPATYYSDTFITHADRLFGRHCRCFLASHKRPSQNRPQGQRIKPTVVIKDSWTMYTAPESDTAGIEAGVEGIQLGDAPSTASAADSAVGSDSDSGPGSAHGPQVSKWPRPGFDPYSKDSYSCLRSEFTMLERITQQFKDNTDLAGTYPRLEHGGWVYQPLDDDELAPDSASGRGGTEADPVNDGHVLDSTHDTLGGLGQGAVDDTPFCVHMRAAIKPVGRGIGSLTSVGQLICVLYDAMKCYMRVFQDCSIIHRDISYNNILAVVAEDDTEDQGRPRGVLIDYDCARDLLMTNYTSRPERTGTFPFMSVANLLALGVERTILDDWESLLYLICVIGTYGLNVRHRVIEGETLSISAWYGDNARDVAKQKRSHMESKRSFRTDILRHFDAELDVPKNDKGLGPLTILAQELHSCLFFNDRWTSEDDRDLYHKAAASLDEDPFVERARYERAFWRKKQRLQPDDSLPAIPDRHEQSIGEELLEILGRAAAMHFN
ncbi:hypothetical protein GGF46_000067 [Coemansia sp. RSA 552]|nr:hypothetical protein GGF46_000067 [Coemansia sp. RSA 552]